MDKCTFYNCPSNAVRDGYCIGHAKLMGIPVKPKELKPIAKVSEKKKAENAINTVEDATLEAAFLAFHKQMNGKCENCGGKSCKGDKKYWRCSAAHIFPKSLFPSIAAHPMNFIELCFWDKSCHTNFDTNILEPPQMKCWPKMLSRFKILYPLMTREEKKRVPEYYLQELEPELVNQ